MKVNYIKFLILGILISSLFAYLEWGKLKHSFLFEVEYTVISKIISEPLAVLHPLIIIPLIGQILLIISLFQNNPSKKLVIAAIAALALLLLLILVVGILSKNYKIALSVTPFLIFTYFTIKKLHFLKK